MSTIFSNMRTRAIGLNKLFISVALFADLEKTIKLKIDTNTIRLNV